MAACGTKFGKTFGSCIWLAQEAWNYKDFLLWWVAPSYAQAKNAFELLKRFLPPRTYEESKSEPSITLLEPDGSRHSKIEFKSGDNPDTLRGFAVHRFVLDEAARMPFEAYTSVYTTVTQTLGKGLIISTPKGRGWFHDMYQRGVKERLLPGESDPWPDWYSIRLPSWTNPHVPMESIKSFKKNMPEDVFKQEVAAEFLDESAGVFRNIRGCIKGVLEQPLAGHRYVVGVDLAKYRDYSVIIVMDANRRHVVYFDQFNRFEWTVQEHRIREASRVYNNAVVCIDSTGPGDQIVENLRARGVPTEPYKIGTSAAKQELIEKLRINIEHGRISYPSLPELIKELEVFEYKITESGIVRYTAPEGKHDDCVISLALANWLADAEPFRYTFRQVRGI